MRELPSLERDTFNGGSRMNVGARLKRDGPFFDTNEGKIAKLMWESTPKDYIRALVKARSDLWVPTFSFIRGGSL